MKHQKNSSVNEVLLPLLLSSFVSVGLLTLRIVVTDSMRLSFLIWNLLLAWMPLVFATWLYERLRTKRTPNWQDGILGLLWLGFLPNSFYLISDLIHLQSSGEVGLLYDTAMIMSFVINGLLLGYISLFVVHKLMKRYISDAWSHFVVQLILVLCAFAIYLGRYLRWNTWDVVVNPAGLVFDVSDRIIRPATHMHTFVITAVFYAVLGSTYAVLYKLAGTLAKVKS